MVAIVKVLVNGMATSLPFNGLCRIIVNALHRTAGDLQAEITIQKLLKHVA